MANVAEGRQAAPGPLPGTHRILAARAWPARGGEEPAGFLRNTSTTESHGSQETAMVPSGPNENPKSTKLIPTEGGQRNAPSEDNSKELAPRPP